MEAGELMKSVAAMKNSGRDRQMVMYGGAKHGFSDPNAAQYGMKEFEYNEAADRRSWRHVDLFLKELFQIADPKIGN
jgi:dienelactone hydrolase